MATQQSTAPDDYFENLARKALSPGWAKREPAMWPAPKSVFVPAIWRYQDALAALTQATAFVSTESAERRNLILVDPIPGNSYATCRHLVGAYQLVMPGETARSHRHSPNALRLILDAAPGVCTLVDGVQIDLDPGDVVLTPQWHWHAHANDSDKPAFWLDFLDVPLVQNMENMFFEHHPEKPEKVIGHEPDSRFRYRGAGLQKRARSGSAVEIGDGQLRTIGLHIIGLAQGQREAHQGRLSNNIYAITSGRVAFDVAPLGRHVLSRGDVIVVPSWNVYSLEGQEDGATLLRVSDEPAFAALGFRNFHPA